MEPILNYKVRELHIDLLFLEEFYSSEVFYKWFLTKTIGLNHCIGKVVRTDHSVFELERESDLEIAFEGEKGEMLFLIENKINANFQKKQAEDYTKRAAEYVRRGKCAECYTVLFAPQEYIERYQAIHKFHYYITFEQVIEFYSQQSDLGQRAAYKINVLRKGIEKYKSSGVRSGNGGEYVPTEVNQGITNFWLNYWKDVTSRYPELTMPKPGEKGPAATFIGLGKSALPKDVFIYHKFVHGAVDIQVEKLKEKAEDFILAFKDYVEEDMVIQRAGKAAVVIRMPITPINPHLFYDEVQPTVFEAQDKAKKLFDWFQKHRVIWNQFQNRMNR
ncbi:PD-(D/E)XK nuclease superfamily protein [Ureibacillus xyleni]|uniref:PD-(D/E)XK nuclease superfamily protein n=1 Tax=Ureibacillus xyleni TaxID=614648 RepID=A0A285S6K8_9BACL|nr:PD-(D/E)XK nuclease family protein [Ureibacillus xyleni]SOC02782.1 PD-(D/E)XK nuclease superfamily protein [Ureibacillus xyleni]